MPHYTHIIHCRLCGNLYANVMMMMMMAMIAIMFTIAIILTSLYHVPFSHCD